MYNEDEALAARSPRYRQSNVYSFCNPVLKFFTTPHPTSIVPAYTKLLYDSDPGPLFNHDRTTFETNEAFTG